MTKAWIEKALKLLDTSLTSVPQELNELDWKESLSPNNQKLAKHLSAFANSPGGGFLVFGIKNETAEPIGIDRDTASSIVEVLASLGRDAVNPMVKIDHAIDEIRAKPVLLVSIPESREKPVHLASGTLEDAFIRSGGTTRKASRQELGGLMLNSKTPQFEELHCSKLMTSDEMLDSIDFAGLFKLLDRPVPTKSDETLKILLTEKLIDEVDGAGYYITNLGALAAAKNLNDFEDLSRKTVRVIQYEGLNKEKTKAEYPGSKGYAIGFSGLINFVQALLPGSEIIRNALRVKTTIYPEIALREIIANALIHQDFSVRGSGPMIEIFDDRLEVSNPGRLLPSKQIDRLIRSTPESRNEVLASTFRRFNICEERGSGFEKAVASIELYGLPPLRFIETENSFRVVLYSPRKFAEMTQSERVEAAYQHSIIRYYSSQALTNSSLRERFKMSEKQRPQVSLVIKEALELGKIKLKNPESASTKFAEYIPYWA